MRITQVSVEGLFGIFNHVIPFLKDLQDIAKLANIDILMATHSPDIIQDRWDLTVELKGTAEVR